MLNKIALFLHVTGALMLFAAIAIEWLCVISFRKTMDFKNIKETIFNYSKWVIVNPIALLLILIPGIYMMSIGWKYASWIIIAFIGIILVGLINSAVTGKIMKSIKKIVSNESNISPVLRSLLNDDSLIRSLEIRTAVLLGIIFLMTVKPDLTGSIVTLIASVVLGFIPLKTKANTSEVLEVEQKIN